MSLRTCCDVIENYTLHLKEIKNKLFLLQDTSTLKTERYRKNKFLSLNLKAE